MKPKVNSGMAMISFYYLFLLHQLYADWRHFSASINGESTKTSQVLQGKIHTWERAQTSLNQTAVELQLVF